VSPSLKAILARFRGDINQAVDYCQQVAHTSPRLAAEYRGYREAFIDLITLHNDTEEA
jgi:hypothetical protein